ncbi:SLAM family member 9-like [Seriola dumerili]|uniref:SLAM family member 9-like n=1 Tax=Seriola dumerili TaxID=41447 RepID=UPI000BBE8936|nr:SLAM family member 9-like [Seriola dumerili]
MALVLLFSAFLLCPFHTKGSSTVPTLYVQQGNDALLDVKTAVQLNKKTDFFWKFNKTYNVGKLAYKVDPIIFDMYEGRVKIFAQNHSLLLKNLQTNDSGYYTAVESAGKDQMVAEYKLIVQKPVSPVYLKVNSSNSCNLTVTCRPKGSNISKTFRCDEQSCSQEGGEEATTYTASINVYLQQSVVICNHSNQVSWKHKGEKISFLCGPHPVPNKTTIISAVTAVVIVGLIASVCIIRKCRRKNRQNTVYAVPQSISPAQTQSQSPTEDASGCSPTSTYALVKFHTTPVESTGYKTTNLPETVYAEVKRANKSNARSPPKQTTPKADETMI